jgi:O-antigen/teichoic acid export membrane protein
LLIVVLSREVLAVFGERYVEGVAALVIVAFAQLYSSSVGPTPRMLAMTENQNVVMAATAVAALVGLAVSVPLIDLSPTPEGKILGAAIGMATGIVVENTATLLAVRRRLGFWPYNLAWAKPLVAGLVAAALAYLVGLLLPLPVLLTLVAAGAVFGVVYLALLLLLGLSRTDKEFLGAFWNVARRYLKRNDS